MQYLRDVLRLLSQPINENLKKLIFFIVRSQGKEPSTYNCGDASLPFDAQTSSNKSTNLSHNSTQTTRQTEEKERIFHSKCIHSGCDKVNSIWKYGF